MYKRQALLCLDVTEAVVDEAVMLGYNLIISHHPLIFKGYKSIIGRDYIEPVSYTHLLLSGRAA